MPPKANRRSGPARPRGAARAAALAQEALELAREDVAARQLLRIGVALLLVGRPLEPLDEGLDVGVEVDGAGDLAVVVARRLLEVGRVDRDADQRLEPAQDRQRVLRVRR